MLEIEEIKNRLGNGITEPYVVRCDNQKSYVVKFPGNKETVKALANELIASELCNYLELPIFEYQLIRVKSSDYKTDMLKEIEPLEGTAFGTLYDDNALTVMNSGSIIRAQNRNDAIKMLIFDLLIGNYDRNPGNLMVNSKRMIMIDHSHIFLLGILWDETQLLLHENEKFKISDLHYYNYKIVMESLQIDKNFYSELNIFIKKIRSLKKEDIERILRNIPEDWNVTELEKKALANFIYNRFQRVEEALEVLNLKVGDEYEK